MITAPVGWRCHLALKTAADDCHCILSSILKAAFPIDLRIHFPGIFGGIAGGTLIGLFSRNTRDHPSRIADSWFNMTIDRVEEDREATCSRS